MITSDPASAEAVALRHWIGGEWIEAGGEPLASINPTRPSETVAWVPQADGAVASQACEAAHLAFPDWAGLTGAQRADALYRWAEAIRARADELANEMVREVGKPLGEAKGEVARCEAILRYFAGEAVRSEGEVIPALQSGSIQFTIREPLGPIALITPWNFPLAIPLWKAAPALAMGNTAVLKPAEAATLMGMRLADTSPPAGLPAGVFNVVFGKGSEIGSALLKHPAIRAVSFTGSDAVGGRVAATCAARNVKFQTEMGGKNVAIVLEDADLGQAASLVAAGAMRFAGQKCTATSRAIVQRTVREAFLEALKAEVAKLPFGDPAEASTAVGPVISSESRDSLLAAIREADARRVVGDLELPNDLQEGFFVSPTVFEGVSPDSRLAQEELFGPVLALLDADDFDAALDLANRTKFGLSASLFTKNVPRALTYVRRIEAGMVRVNGDTTGVDPHAPFGGMKGSSSHSREQGPAAKEFFTEIKTVQINP
jgi:alpha-ketoglutaric semialdehyde dehydrogenase